MAATKAKKKPAAKRSPDKKLDEAKTVDPVDVPNDDRDDGRNRDHKQPEKAPANKDLTRVRDLHLARTRRLRDEGRTVTTAECAGIDDDTPVLSVSTDEGRVQVQVDDGPVWEGDQHACIQVRHALDTAFQAVS